jgi:hypothetical protein
MKIAICSDVHLEFGQLELENTQNAEVLVLSGDICTACDLRVTDSILSSAKTDRYLDFFTACSRNFPHVVYVMGNHEHYHGDYATSAGILRDAMKQCGDNIHFLDKEVWEHQDHVFIGGTLWTDMNGEDEMTMNHVSRRMNDFQICKNSYEKLISEHKSQLLMRMVITRTMLMVSQCIMQSLRLVRHICLQQMQWKTTKPC